jgi:hypothetical protein
MIHAPDDGYDTDNERRGSQDGNRYERVGSIGY